jgi:hypothetical protein
MEGFKEIVVTRGKVNSFAILIICVFSTTLHLGAVTLIKMRVQFSMLSIDG